MSEEEQEEQEEQHEQEEQEEQEQEAEDKQVLELVQKFSLDLPKDLHKQLKQYCLNNEMKMKDVVIQAVENLLQ